jgi:hypothetical protein
VLHFSPPSVDARIRQAIAGKNLVEVRYKYQSRVVEPHDYGVHRGVEWLLVYQLKTTGATTGKDAIGWRLFEVSKIESLVVLETPFKGSRLESGQDHHAWDVLYARVE